MVDIDKTKQSNETERNLGILETKIETNNTDLSTLITALTNRVAILEGYFSGATTDSTHYVSNTAGSYVGKKVTITNGLIKGIAT